MTGGDSVDERDKCSPKKGVVIEERLPADRFEKVAASAEVHDDVEVVVVIEGIVQPDYAPVLGDSVVEVDLATEDCLVTENAPGVAFACVHGSSCITAAATRRC